MSEKRFNASFDQATDAVVEAFDWLMPADQEVLAGVMIELDNAISAVLADYAPTSSESRDLNHLLFG